MLVGVVMTVLMVTVLGNFGKGLKERSKFGRGGGQT